jgi:hypothetical protein
MVPSGPITGPGVTAPSSCRRQRIVPAVGPDETEAPLWRASCNAAGHGAQLARPGGSAGTRSPAVDDIGGGVFGAGAQAPASPTHPTIAIAISLLCHRLLPEITDSVPNRPRCTYAPSRFYMPGSAVGNGVRMNAIEIFARNCTFSVAQNDSATAWSHH